ncbi:hypothetical protein HPB52_019392 [Rhipicephalus sanguineus]|uniref:Uncharacterized protein n=1 Tax=Rhipicephalus sanguineus TaxID=34632 RepID=A0A9D4QAY6_RHISA|nr:hypothetical protein HPB52_019392 [Rhipicephalus sanguineus]
MEVLGSLTDVADPSWKPHHKPSASQHSRASGQPQDQGITCRRRRYALHHFTRHDQHFRSDHSNRHGKHDDEPVHT